MMPTTAPPEPQVGGGSTALGWLRATPAEWRQDALLAVAITIFAQFDVAFGFDNSARYGSMVALVVSTAVATLVLALRRLVPLLTAVAVAMAIAGPMLAAPLTLTLWGAFLSLLIATYSSARHSERVYACLGVAATVTAVVVVMLRNPDAGTAANIPFAAVPFVVVVVAGRVLRARDRSHSDDRARAQRLEAEREEAIRDALAEERSRIARELHDIVAHCVSVMVVQAGAAEDLLDRDPPQARQPLRSVQDTGRQAIGELGRMLGLLRGHGSANALTPQPGTADLSELVDHMTGIGLPVKLTVEGTAHPLPPGVDLTVYRFVQEALTNALKHAAPTTAHVALRYEEESVRVAVRDTGRTGAPKASSPDRVGHGLLGMRERVGLYGGTLASGPTGDGGFAVTASLPLETAAR